MTARAKFALLALVVPVVAATCARHETSVDFVSVEKGSFTMGCTQGDPDCAASERPALRVEIDRSFSIAATETTDAQYTECVKAGACRAPAYRAGWKPWHRRSDLPVVWVSWDDADRFCRWLGGRLPSSAEWEYAARGGQEGQRYPWGNESPVADEGAPAGATFSASGTGPAPVASYSANAFGLYDMAGNVWEWVADEWHESHEGSPLDGSARVGSGDDAYRVVRGGSCFDQAQSLRVSVVGKVATEGQSVNVGFRCVRELPDG